VGGAIYHTAASGNGPVNALDAALRKALSPRFPGLKGVSLHDYKVRILDGAAGTGATTRVLIESGRCLKRWTTVGCSSNIIEASLAALVDSFEYALFARAAEGFDRPTERYAGVRPPADLAGSQAP
jgi:2-isopropylmalate synthase